MLAHFGSILRFKVDPVGSVSRRIVLGPPWNLLGAILGACCGVLERHASRRRLGGSVGPMFNTKEAKLGYSPSPHWWNWILGRFWVFGCILGASWCYIGIVLGPSWGRPGGVLEHLGASCGRLGRLGSMVGPMFKKKHCLCIGCELTHAN